MFRGCTFRKTAGSNPVGVLNREVLVFGDLRCARFVACFLVRPANKRPNRGAPARDLQLIGTPISAMLDALVCPEN